MLRDLSKRPESLGGVKQIRIRTFTRGNFGAFIQYDVVNQATGIPYTYEYFSWRHGPKSGAKGIVLVQTEGVITHFIVLRGEKFAPGTYVWDTVGGFAEDSIPDQVLTEIREELGTSELEVSELINLGRLMMDAGMTNNHPKVFAAIIDARNAQRIPRNPPNPDIYELRAGAFMFPISYLAQMLQDNDDPFLHCAVTRCVGRRIIPAEALVLAS